MGAQCCAHGHHRQGPDDRRRNARYHRVLWAVLGLNGAMFIVEIVAGLAAGSVSLQADALDFLADAGNYGISLFVIGMALHYRAKAALVKGATMGAFGLWVVGATVWHAVSGTLPDAGTMGAVGFAALIVNAAVFAMLWAYREGDSNMRSVWLCSRNDVIGNIAVMLAALGVFGTGTGWPDVVVAAVMGALALQGAWVVIRHATGELRHGVPATTAAEWNPSGSTCPSKPPRNIARPHGHASSGTKAPDTTELLHHRPGADGGLDARKVTCRWPPDAVGDASSITLPVPRRLASITESAPKSQHPDDAMVIGEGGLASRNRDLRPLLNAIDGIIRRETRPQAAPGRLSNNSALLAPGPRHNVRHPRNTCGDER